jgi:hypothetical protein
MRVESSDWRILAVMLTSQEVSSLVTAELLRISDETLLARIRELLVSPYPVERGWDYGRAGEQYTCWTVLEHSISNTGIAYCPQGFGPSEPWGLVHLSGDYMTIGMDSGWFPTLESAMRGSMAWDGPDPEGYEIP